MRRFPLLLCLGLVLASCGTMSSNRYDSSDLQKALDSRPPLFTDADIAELEALAPQLPTPFRLGIAPPLSADLEYSSSYLGYRPEYQDSDTWAEDEAAVIEDFGRRLREVGTVSELVLLPRLLVQGGKVEEGEGEEPVSQMAILRQAAARHHLDAVLVVERVSATQSHASFLSILDLTILGAAIVPSYEVSSMTVVEAALVDTRNGYLYASGRGDGSFERHTSAFESERVMNEARMQSRVRALADLGEELLRQASLTGPAVPMVEAAQPSMR